MPTKNGRLVPARLDAPASIDGTMAAPLRSALLCGVLALPAPAAAATPRLLFGLGPEAGSARGSALVQQSPIRMLTSWYNGPNDLAWMSGWRTSEVPSAYRAGYALHLIVYTGDPETTLSTRYGTACGRAYPLSSRFLSDMRTLARTFAGRRSGPPLYVTLFTEFQTYPCHDSAWARDRATTNYYRALKDRYKSALRGFHRLAHNARVSLGWGGWQADWSDAATGGGRALFRHFADVMRASDFQSFQAMSSKGNAGEIVRMTRALGRYGPVMLAHYKPDDGSQAIFDADMHTILSDAYLRKVRASGLFALSFMDSSNLDAEPGAFAFVKQAVTRYASPGPQARPSWLRSSFSVSRPSTGTPSGNSFTR
jgi:hypothetical protein